MNSWLNLGLAMGLVLAAADVEIGLIRKPEPQQVDTGNAPVIPESSPDLGEVIGAHLQTSTREIVVHTMPPKYGRCGPCEQQKALFGDGWPGVRVTYTDVEDPRYADRGYPFVTLPDVKLVLRDSRVYQRSEIEAALREHKPPAIPQAVSIGRIQLKSTIAALLDKVQADRTGAAVVTLGSASVLLPASMPMTVSATHEQVSVVFTGARPRARYALLGCDITGVTATRDRMTVSLAGMPDLVMQVE